MNAIDNDPMTFEGPAELVAANQGVFTVDMRELRNMARWQKGGTHVAADVARKLADAGLGHFPSPLPTLQDKLVRLYTLDSAADDLITAVLNPGAWNDRKLRKKLEDRVPRQCPVKATRHAAPVPPKILMPVAELRSVADVRWPSLFAAGVIRVGNRLHLSCRGVEWRAKFVNEGGNVSYRGETMTASKWGELVTGWPSINIYDHTFVEYEGQRTPIKDLRQRILSASRRPGAR